jgi:hypothetical protein
MHEIVDHPAEQPLPQSHMTLSAHDDEIGLSPFCFRHQLGSDLTRAALDAVKGRVDLVMPEMIDGIDP